MRVIVVFWAFPVVGSDMLAWLVVTSRVFVFAPCRRLVLFLVSPSVVSVGNEPFSYRRLVLWVFFLPPEGFFLCWSPCHTDIRFLPSFLVCGLCWFVALLFKVFVWLG